MGAGIDGVPWVSSEDVMGDHGIRGRTILKPVWGAQAQRA